MQCPLCHRVLNVKPLSNSFACYCSDIQDYENKIDLANIALNFEGDNFGNDNKRFSIWIDVNQDINDTLIFYYSKKAWDLTIDHHGKSQPLLSGTYDISPEAAVQIMRRYQNLLVFA